MKKLILFLLLLISLSANAANKHYAFKGKLGKNISFRLDFEEDTYHGIMIGQTTYYRKNGKIAKIKAYGIRQKQEGEGENNNVFTLTEFDGIKMCGNIVLYLNADGSFDEGSWFFGGREYKMNDIEVLSGDDSPVFFKPVDIEKASGVYRFSCPSGNMYDYGGTFQMYYYRGNVGYSACQVTPNIAETTGKAAEIFQNRFYFNVDNASYDVFAFEDVLFVERSNPQTGPVESFGANADVAGIYVKTSQSLEGDVLHVFDEEMAFCDKYHFSVFALNELWMEAIGGETTFPDEITMKDINDDGIEEVIARYSENKTDKYEVSRNRYAVFTVNCGELEVVATAQGKLENLEIADGYVIKNTTNADNSRTTHDYFRLTGTSVGFNATMTEADAKSYTIDEKPVEEKEFLEQVKIHNVMKVTDLDGWHEVPGNIHRNETAARG